MVLRNQLTRSLIAGLACVGILSGCAGSHHRKVRIPRPQWPQHWAHPTLKPNGGGPPLPVPADPSGSPYAPQSPRGLYVPSGPAPESTLGLPVPPPLPPGSDEAAPAPERLPPAAGDMDVSFENGSSRRPEVVPPPPPNAADMDTPRVAERFDALERNRQPVRLETPELDSSTSGGIDVPAPSPALRRSPVDAFPQPRDLDNDYGNKSGHTPPFDEQESDELPDEDSPESVERNTRPTVEDSESLPTLRDPDESELTFPGVHKQTSANKTNKPARVERLASKLSVEKFYLTRDARPDSETEIIAAKSLKRGQNLVLRTQLGGLKHGQRSGQTVTRVNFHFELRDTQNQLLFATPKATSTEPLNADDSVRPSLRWLAIPSSLKAGKYTLQLHAQDGFSRKTVLVEMPVEVN